MIDVNNAQHAEMALLNIMRIDRLSQKPDRLSQKPNRFSQKPDWLSQKTDRLSQNQIRLRSPKNPTWFASDPL